jgi:hypothetical protein
VFTKNNFVFVKSENYGDEYKKVGFADLKMTDQVISSQLPDCNVSFPVEIEDLVEIDSDGEIVVYQIVLTSTMGNIYTIECPISSKEAFCRYSKFKRMDNIIQWYSNFALVDWRGHPCKIEVIKESMYEGKLYDITVKDTNNVFVNGLVFRSCAPEDVAQFDIDEGLPPRDEE